MVKDLFSQPYIFIFEIFFHGIRYILPDFHGKLENITADQLLIEKSIKADVLEITTNEFSNVNLSNYGYTVENTIAVYVVGGLSGYNAHARLYTYNGLLYALITDSGSNNGFKNTKVELKMLHI